MDEFRYKVTLNGRDVQWGYGMKGDGTFRTSGVWMYNADAAVNFLHQVKRDNPVADVHLVASFKE